MVRPVGDVARVPALDRVVAGVVGDHGDLPGPDARLDGERLVAADRHVLGEAEPVLLDQFPAEKLGVGQGEGQLRVVEGDVAVARVQLLVDVASVRADHLADDHVGLVGVGAGDHPLQRLLAEVVVRADEVHEATGRQVQGAVARGGRAARVGLVDDGEDVRVPLRVAVEFLAAVVGRTVVDGHDLEPLVTDALAHQRVEALGEVRHRVVDGHDHRDIGCGHLLGSCSWSAGIRTVAPLVADASTEAATSTVRSPWRRVQMSAGLPWTASRNSSCSTSSGSRLGMA